METGIYVHGRFAPYRQPIHCRDVLPTYPKVSILNIQTGFYDELHP